ncbi:MAG: insulinase family protein [Gemmatimonadetes bacterium]|nr:insulinase family protein [Gemmatimonadota bacterium]
MPRFNSRTFAAALGAALVLAATDAAAQLAPGDRLPVDPAVTTGRLENGFHYFIRENQQPRNRAELMLVVNAGSLLEADDQRGLAHFVEHMAFNGTRNFPRQELVRYLESIGMQFGADLNAYTGFDETVYMLTVPTDTGTALERAFVILEDWAHQQTFDAAEIEKERGVVIEEWRLGQGAGARMRDIVFPVLLRGSRYADRLPIGTRESLEGFDPAALRRFYADWYRPDLMAVIAVGDFERERVERLVREHFGSIPRATSPQERPDYPVPPHGETLVAIATDREATTATVEVYWKRANEQRTTVAGYRTSLTESIYTGMLNARLAEVARQADPPFIGASSSAGSLLRSKSAYILSALVPDDGIERGLGAILTEAERVARFGFTATELEREKRDVLRAYEAAFAERDKTNSIDYANEYIRHFLEAEPIPGIAVEFGLVQQYIDGITLDEVNALSAEWMQDGDRVIVVQAPEKEGLALPSREALLATLDAVDAPALEPYEDRTADALIATLPEPGRIVAERSIPRIDVTEWTLSNGIRVLLRPTDFKDDEVVFRAWSPGGLSLVSDADYMSAGFSTTLISASGLGELDAGQLQKALQGTAVSVRPTYDDASEGLAGNASPKDLETMFQLIWLNVTAPRGDSVAFQSIVSRLRGLLANRAASPDAAFQDTLTVTLSQYHPRARPVNVDVLDEVDLGRAMATYGDRFGDAGDFTFAFVGSFDLEQIRPLVERYLASLPASGRVEQPRDNGVRPPEGVVEKVVEKGVEPRSQTIVLFSGPAEFTRERRLALAVLADVLDVRLRDVLREDLGGTYGVEVSQGLVRVPWAHYLFSIGFSAAPERLEPLTQTVFAEIEKLKTDGPAPETLANVRQARLRSHETNLRQNSFWLTQILNAAAFNEPLDGFLDLPDRIEALDAQTVRDAAGSYLNPDRFVRVSLVPAAGGT